MILRIPRVLTASAWILLLSGCSSVSPSNDVPSGIPPCRDASRQPLENAARWVALMGCSSPSVVPRPGEGWADVWQQSILLSRHGLTESQRQQMIPQLRAQQAQVPQSVLPLYDLWLEKLDNQQQLQQQQRQISELSAQSDEISRLRQQQIATQRALAEKKRQLQRLTDIERQLSGR